jgi:hypothetical protein
MRFSCGLKNQLSVLWKQMKMLRVTREQHARSKSAVENWIKNFIKKYKILKRFQIFKNLSLILDIKEEI